MQAPVYRNVGPQYVTGGPTALRMTAAELFALKLEERAGAPGSLETARRAAGLPQPWMRMAGLDVQKPAPSQGAPPPRLWKGGTVGGSSRFTRHNHFSIVRPEPDIRLSMRSGNVMPGFPNRYL